MCYVFYVLIDYDLLNQNLLIIVEYLKTLYMMLYVIPDNFK